MANGQQTALTANAAMLAMGMPPAAGGGGQPMFAARDVTANAKLSLGGDAGPATSGGGMFSGGSSMFDSSGWTSGRSSATNSRTTPMPYGPPQSIGPVMSDQDATMYTYGTAPAAFMPGLDLSGSSFEPIPDTFGGLNSAWIIGGVLLLLILRKKKGG